VVNEPRAYHYYGRHKVKYAKYKSHGKHHGNKGRHRGKHHRRHHDD
jgi:hypothetical protein